MKKTTRHSQPKAFTPSTPISPSFDAKALSTPFVFERRSGLTVNLAPQITQSNCFCFKVCRSGSRDLFIPSVLYGISDMVASKPAIESLLLPVTIAFGKGVPRKRVLRFVREIAGALVIFCSLVMLVRHHHASARVQLATSAIAAAPYVNGTAGPAVSAAKAGPALEHTWPVINPRQTVEDLKAIPRNIYYLRKEPVMYCYIPKVACSRFKPLMRKREGFSNWADQKSIHGKNGLERLMWLGRDEGLTQLHNMSYFKYVVVRDPFSRLVSAYQNKVATPWPDQRSDFWNKHLRNECPSLIASITMPDQGPLLSLEKFLECLNAEDATEPSNEHWRPQTQLCGLDYIKYDKYLHMENLAGDAEDLLAELNWDENPAAFQMQRNPVYSKQLASYFSTKAIKLALQYYKNDFEVLKYPSIPVGTIDFYSVFDGNNFQPGFVPPREFKAFAPETATRTSRGS